MKLGKNDKPQWFFAWVKVTRPYITSVCAWTHKDLISETEHMLGQGWDKTYRQGGRAIKCDVTPKEQP